MPIECNQSIVKPGKCPDFKFSNHDIFCENEVNFTPSKFENIICQGEFYYHKQGVAGTKIVGGPAIVTMMS